MEITYEEIKLITKFIKSVKDDRPPPILPKELALKLKNLLSR